MWALRNGILNSWMPLPDFPLGTDCFVAFVTLFFFFPSADFLSSVIRNDLILSAWPLVWWVHGA